MSWNEHKEEYNVLIEMVRKGTLDTLSKEQLKNYHTLLANNGAGVWSEPFYWRLCDEIKNLIHQKEKEEFDAKRHHEIQRKLEELKKPHWTVLPIFWLALISASAAAIGVFISLNPRPQPTAASTHEPEKSIVTLAPKKLEPQQSILKPVSSSNASHRQGSRH